MSDDEIDFEEQIRLEEEERGAFDESGKRKTRIDDDGTEFEWDPHRKAWFPKIDDNFIAQYQMNYGGQSEVDSGTLTIAPVVVPDGFEHKTEDPDYHYFYYYSYYAGQSSESANQQSNTEKEITQLVGSTAEKVKDLRPNQNDHKEESKSEEDNVKIKETNEASVVSDEQKENQEDDMAKVDQNFVPKIMPESDKPYSEFKHWYGWYTQYYQTAEPITEHKSTKIASENYHKKEYWDQYYHDAPENASLPHQGDSQSDEPGGDKKKKVKKRKPEKAPAWFDSDKATDTTSVYVSNLPLDISEEDFKELMSKCGMIAFDALTRKPKLKLYKDTEGQLKGDGWCRYIKSESVDLAMQILDGYDLKGNKLHVEHAKFEMKGGKYDASKKRRKMTNKEKRKFKEKEEKLFDWRPEKLAGARSKNEKTIIMKNLFVPSDFEENFNKINEMKENITKECEKYGSVKKVVVHDRHEDGVVSVMFSDPDEADLCKLQIGGRWFLGHHVFVETWDGKTKYTKEETEEERNARDKKWQQFLLDDEKASKENSETK